MLGHRQIHFVAEEVTQYLPEQAYVPNPEESPIGSDIFFSNPGVANPAFFNGTSSM